VARWPTTLTMRLDDLWSDTFSRGRGLTPVAS
jgi:hypothetical protein